MRYGTIRHAPDTAFVPHSKRDGVLRPRRQTLVSIRSHLVSDGLIAGARGQHVAATIPSIGTVAVLLYCLLGVTAEACCPVSR